MSIDLPHLASRLFNRPHLIAAAKLDIILGAVAPRVFDARGGQWRSHDREVKRNRLPLNAFANDDDLIEDMPKEAYRVRCGIGIIPVHGTLVRRGGWLNSMSGLTSYEGLLASFREATADPDVKAVMLDIDSSGGEAGGVFDLVEEMRRLSAKHNKPVWAHANEEAASAAYAIACAASQIWVARTGDVGSIGVVCAHIDQSKYDEKQGLKWTFIYCGEHKTHGNPHQPLADAALSKIQADSDTLYEMFVQLVADYRPMSAKAVRDTKADTYLGIQAVEKGLADREGTFDEALLALINTLDGQNDLKKGTSLWPDATGLKTEKTKNSKMKIASKSLTKRKRTLTPKTLMKSTRRKMTSSKKKQTMMTKSTKRKMRTRPSPKGQKPPA